METKSTISMILEESTEDDVKIDIIYHVKTNIEDHNNYENI